MSHFLLLCWYCSSNVCALTFSVVVSRKTDVCALTKSRGLWCLGDRAWIYWSAWHFGTATKTKDCSFAAATLLACPFETVFCVHIKKIKFAWFWNLAKFSSGQICDHFANKTNNSNCVILIASIYITQHACGVYGEWRVFSSLFRHRWIQFWAAPVPQQGSAPFFRDNWGSPKPQCAHRPQTVPAPQPRQREREPAQTHHVPAQPPPEVRLSTRSGLSGLETFTQTVTGARL